MYTTKNRFWGLVAEAADDPVFSMALIATTTTIWPGSSCENYLRKLLIIEMEKNDPSKPIPEGWKLVRARQRDGSKVLCYKCAKTGQKFFTYEDLMRYVNYAKENNLPVYCPDLFRFRCSRKKKQKASLFDADRSEGNLELAASESNLPRTSEAEIVEVADPDRALRSSALRNLNTEELCPAEPCGSKSRSYA